MQETMKLIMGHHMVARFKQMKSAAAIMERHHKDYKKYANEYWEEYILKNIKTILKSRIIPKSHFLDNLEMKIIVKNCFEKWKEEQELFGIDTTKYWVV